MSLKGVEKHDGIKFNYLCPFNEPDGHWNWIGPKQEGTPATNREIARAIRLISKEFVNNQIDTQILVNESSDYRCMFDTHMTNWERGIKSSLSLIRTVQPPIWVILPMFPG